MPFPLTLLLNPFLKSLDKELSSLNHGLAEGWLLGAQPKQISGDPHLTITVFTCTDTDQRDLQLLAQSPREAAWNMFNHNGKTASLLQFLALIEESLLAAWIPPLPP